MTESAIPAIREHLVRALSTANNAKAQRERHAKFAEAYAYASCLRELRKSGIDWPDGISLGQFWSDEVQQARDWLKTDADLLLGRAV